MRAYEVNIQFTERLLASSPADPEIYKQFIASRARAEQDTGDEVTSLPAAEQEKIGWSVFHIDEKGVFLFDYQLRGFLKEAATAITGKGITAIKSKIDKWVFVFPRKIHLMRDDAHIKNPDGVFERPLRAMTAQGPRVTPKRSDYVEGRVSLAATIKVLPLGKEISEDILRSWLEYGAMQGLGEFRNGSFGRFEFALTPGK